MRDLFLTLFIFGYMPWIIIRPHYGIFMWSWLTYMTPHRLTWSFAFDFRFNYFVTIITLYSIFRSKDYKIRVPINFATPGQTWSVATPSEHGGAAKRRQSR
ncbi:MAG: hypothetical protein HQL78_13330, partial [Magnetococcales bacterium]|nr:hypothetical protein [Magnetococcales bacterium]